MKHLIHYFENSETLQNGIRGSNFLLAFPSTFHRTPLPPPSPIQRMNGNSKLNLYFANIPPFLFHGVTFISFFLQEISWKCEKIGRYESFILYQSHQLIWKGNLKKVAMMMTMTKEFPFKTRQDFLQLNTLYLAKTILYSKLSNVLVRWGNANSILVRRVKQVNFTEFP